MGLRLFNRARLEIETGWQLDENNTGHFILKVTNRSFTTLRAVAGFVTINNTIEDILHQHISFCRKKVNYELLSWAKIVDDKNKPETELHQGQMQSLQILMHANGEIQIPSEGGYFLSEKRTPRIWLKNKDYEISLVITAENMFPK